MNSSLKQEKDKLPVRFQLDVRIEKVKIATWVSPDANKMTITFMRDKKKLTTNPSSRIIDTVSWDQVVGLNTTLYKKKDGKYLSKQYEFIVSTFPINDTIATFYLDIANILDNHDHTIYEEKIIHLEPAESLDKDALLTVRIKIKLLEEKKKKKLSTSITNLNSNIISRDVSHATRSTASSSNDRYTNLSSLGFITSKNYNTRNTNNSSPNDERKNKISITLPNNSNKADTNTEKLEKKIKNYIIKVNQKQEELLRAEAYLVESQKKINSLILEVNELKHRENAETKNALQEKIKNTILEKRLLEYKFENSNLHIPETVEELKIMVEETKLLTDKIQKIIYTMPSSSNDYKLNKDTNVLNNNKKENLEQSSGLEYKLKALENENNKLTGIIEEQKITIEEYEIKNKELEFSIENSNLKIKKYENDINNEKSQIDSLNIALKQELIQEKNKNDKLIKENEELHYKVNNSNDSNELIENNNSERIKELLKLLKNAKEESLQLKYKSNSLDGINNKLEEVKKENKLLTIKVSTLEGQLEEERLYSKKQDSHIISDTANIGTNYSMKDKDNRLSIESLKREIDRYQEKIKYLEEENYNLTITRNKIIKNMLNEYNDIIQLNGNLNQDDILLENMELKLKIEEENLKNENNNKKNNQLYQDIITKIDMLNEKNEKNEIKIKHFITIINNVENQKNNTDMNIIQEDMEEDMEEEDDSFLTENHQNNRSFTEPESEKNTLSSSTATTIADSNPLKRFLRTVSSH